VIGVPDPARGVVGGFELEALDGAEHALLALMESLVEVA
jgi:hypothetical protein